MAKLRSFQLLKPAQVAEKYPYAVAGADAYKKALSPACKEALANAQKIFESAPCNVNKKLYTNIADFLADAKANGEICPFQ